MNIKLLAGSAVALALAAASSAGAATVTFTPGDAPIDGFSPSPGFTVINNFNDGLVPADVTINHGTVLVISPPGGATGAPPANSDPAGTDFLSVLGGGDATIALSNVAAFEFDWGSVDTFNTLTIFQLGGPNIVISPSTVARPADGNQAASATNGLLKVTGGTFTGFEMTSGKNSFEIDNVATRTLLTGPGVPEPASWALMIMGFGAAGAMLRSNKRRAAQA